MTTTETTIPTLTTIDDARTTLEDLAGRYEWVSVFWDRGWGDSGQTADITVIVNGDGQKPLARLTADVYRALLDQQIIAPNSYGGYKKRKLHDYKTPPPAPKPAVDPGKVAEKLIRDLLNDMADKPLRAQLFRGITASSSPFQSPIREEVVTTPVCGPGWFVRVIPGARDAAISAAGAPEPFGFSPDILGEVTVLSYPRTADGDVDVEALAGDEFRARFVAAVEEKLALIEATHAKV